MTTQLSTQEVIERLPGMSPKELIAELQLSFGYYGNAAHNQQPERVDDALERFKAVRGEVERRLNGAMSTGSSIEVILENLQKANLAPGQHNAAFIKGWSTSEEHHGHAALPLLSPLLDGEAPQGSCPTLYPACAPHLQPR